jgi:hypothetical protein
VLGVFNSALVVGACVADGRHYHHRECLGKRREKPEGSSAFHANTALLITMQIKGKNYLFGIGTNQFSSYDTQKFKLSYVAPS